MPTDIPWKRVCVSDETFVAIPCEDHHKRPSVFGPSMAIHRYDPAAEFQPADGDTLIYFKISVTLAPMGLAVDDPTLTGGRSWDEIDPEEPCFGAVLDVVVAPPEAERPGLDAQDYPYIADVEPKKREFVELISESGEVLSGSVSESAFTKGSSSLRSQERQSGQRVMRGFNVGASGGLSAGVSDGAQGGISVDGGFSRSNEQSSGNTLQVSHGSESSETSNASTERRELLSHSTTTSQLYSLLQTYHVGTNRTAFVLEPRPRTASAAGSIFTSPRALEGVQEFILIVRKPAALTDVCISTQLRTVHLDETTVGDISITVPRKESLFVFHEAVERDSDPPKNGKVHSPWETHVDQYTAPDGWVIKSVTPSTVADASLPGVVDDFDYSHKEDDWTRDESDPRNQVSPTARLPMRVSPPLDSDPTFFAVTSSVRTRSWRKDKRDYHTPGFVAGTFNITLSRTFRFKTVERVMRMWLLSLCCCESKKSERRVIFETKPRLPEVDTSIPVDLQDASRATHRSSLGESFESTWRPLIQRLLTRDLPTTRALEFAAFDPTKDTHDYVLRRAAVILKNDPEVARYFELPVATALNATLPSQPPTRKKEDASADPCSARAILIADQWVPSGYDWTKNQAIGVLYPLLPFALTVDSAVLDSLRSIHGDSSLGVFLATPSYELAANKDPILTYVSVCSAKRAVIELLAALQ